MYSFYLTFLVIGAVAVVLQLGLGLAGLDGHPLLADGDHDGADGLDLFTIRALSAAAAAFGLVGLGLGQLGLGAWLALPLALVAGLGAAGAVAAAIRSLRRLEQDRSFRIESTIGLPATVALSIPGAMSGEGKVHLVAHERFQELAAMTSEEAMPSGTAVVVVDVRPPDTLVVIRHLSLFEETHVPRS
jgi:hypothetical protein